MGNYRLPTSVPASIPELWERFREYVRQTEPVVLENVRIGTTETIVPHGLGEAPGWVAYDSPHCRAIVKQTRRADSQRLYLRATNDCVVSVRLERARPAVPPNSVLNGGFKFADWDPGGADNDHLVKSSLTDATTVGGLVEKTEAGSNVTLTEVTTGGVKKLRITSSYSVTPLGDADPLPLGAVDPGVSAYASRQDHVHPQPDPEVEGAFLYPAKVPDPLNKGNVRCVFGVDGGGGGGAWGSFIMGWTKSGDTYTRTDTTPPLSTSHFDGQDPQVYGADGYSLMTGALVCLPPSVDLTAPDKVDWGVFEILDTGRHFDGAFPVDTHAKLRRVGTLNASADFVQGITYYIEAGTEFGGQYATLQDAAVVLGTTEQNWTFSASAPAWDDSYELLSSAEITTRGASAATLDISATATAGSANMVTDDGSYDFDTVGVLPDTLPAGKIDWYLKDVILSGDKGDGVENTIICQLIDNDGAGGLSVIATASTQHIDWSTLYSHSARDLHCQGAIAVDWVRTPGHYLTQRYLFYTDSTTAVSCSFTYSSADRYTKVGTTWQNAVIGGTNWHPDLTGRDEADQHPWSSIEPVGTAVFPMPSLTIGASGALTLTAGNIFLVDPDNQNLGQISIPTGLTAGETVPITLIFTDTVRLLHGETSDAGFAPLYLHRVASINNPLSFRYAKSVADFAYVGGEWLLLRYHSTQ